MDRQHKVQTTMELPRQWCQEMQMETQIRRRKGRVRKAPMDRQHKVQTTMELPRQWCQEMQMETQIHRMKGRVRQAPMDRQHKVQTTMELSRHWCQEMQMETQIHRMKTGHRSQEKPQLKSLEGRVRKAPMDRQDSVQNKGSFRNVKVNGVSRKWQRIIPLASWRHGTKTAVASKCSHSVNSEECVVCKRSGIRRTVE